MNTQKYLVWAVVLVGVVLGLYFPRGGNVDVAQVANAVYQQVMEKLPFGSSGQDESFPKNFLSGFFSGGRVASSTTSTTGTLLAATLENATTLDYTLNLADVTLTFPASSTIGFMRSPGDTKVFYVRNATTTAAMDITFAAGTGLNYKKATSTKVLVGDTDGGNTARVTLIRQSDSDIDMVVEQFLD